MPADTTDGTSDGRTPAEPVIFIPPEAVRLAMAARAHALRDRPDLMVLSDERLTGLMLAAAAPLIAAAERESIAAVLLRAAAGRREYLSRWPDPDDEASVRLRMAAECCESAAALITDPWATMLAVPSWRWTDEELSALRGTAGDPDPFEAVSTVGAAVAAAADPDAPAFLDPGGRDAPVVYHACPEGGMYDPLPCCGRTRHEVSGADRIAFAAVAVTCRG